MNNFQVTSFGASPKDTANILGKQDSDKNSFKESLTGIEKYWNDLNLELDKKRKDLDELERLDKAYSMDEFEYIKDRVREKIQCINTELISIQKIMWDVRTKILFYNSNGQVFS
jgi:hypothetical protein